MKYYLILFLSFIVNVMAAKKCETTADCEGLDVCFNDEYSRIYKECHPSGGYIVLVVVGVVIVTAVATRIPWYKCCGY
tara:strand:- start:292 stop:525 length:234 start_codon:yes stop_codon:yes gene_type:complete